MNKRDNAYNRLTYSIVWPLISIFQAVKTVKLYGGYVRDHHSVGLLQQFLKVLKHSIRHNLASETYYYASLWRPEQNPEYYIQSRETRNLTKFNLALPTCDRTIKIRDKLYAHAFFKEKGISVAPIIASVHSGNRIDWHDNQQQLPSESLFLKPASLAGGKGIEKWVYLKSDNSWGYSKFKYKEDQLLNHFVSLSNNYEIIVQPCLKNHPVIMDLGDGALSTIRMVTVMHPQKSTAQMTMSAFRIARSGSIIDNLGQGGLVSNVSDAGILGIAKAKDIRVGEHETHPDTGAKILGRKLPHWDAAVILAQKAHELVPHFFSVGWDIALLESGPVIIEANLAWGTQVVQVAAPNTMITSDFIKIMTGILDHEAKLTSQTQVPG